MSQFDELSYGPYLKLDRANHHINDLNVRIESFLDEEPFKVIIKHHRKAGKRTFHIKTEKPIPPEFSLIIGDAAHNLRSALDITLYQMARDRAKRPNRIQYPFPANDSTEAMESAFEGGQVKFAGKKVEESIRFFKPDKNLIGGLGSLHALDIQDKHRLIILTGQNANFVTGSGSEEALKSIMNVNNVPAGVNIIFAGSEDKGAFLTIREPYVLSHLPDSEEEAKVQPAFILIFSEKGEPVFPGKPVIPVLRDLAIETRRVVDDMINAFLDPDNTFPA